MERAALALVPTIVPIKFLEVENLMNCHLKKTFHFTLEAAKHIEGHPELPTNEVQAGADSEGGAREPGPPPLSDHTTIIKFSGPVLKYFLHSFSIV